MTEQTSDRRDDLEPAGQTRLLTGLSARLLVMTVVFVMLAELLIWTPSIAQFRRQYLEDNVAKAHLAMIAVGALDAETVSAGLEEELLFNTDTYGIVLNLTDQRMLMVGEDMPPRVDLDVDLTTDRFWGYIGDAFMTLMQTENRVLRVMGYAPKNRNIGVEIIMDETPLRDAMIDYSHRILGLSIVISLFTAMLVFLTLQWLMVRPILRMTRSLARFRENPEAQESDVAVSERTDEIGLAQRELVSMRNQVRLALRQKSRLATLGEAVAKINHDLRNSLATAVLAFDRLNEIDDPEVKRLSPRLYKAISRATTLCSQTLEYVGASDMNLRRDKFHLSELIAEVHSEIKEHQRENPRPGQRPDAQDRMNIDGRVPFAISIEGDRTQLFRVFYNLALNACHAGAAVFTIDCEVTPDGQAVIDLVDDGPGVPADIRDNLFKPFTTSGDGGTGLGLVIVHDIVRAHHGDIILTSTGTDGAAFRITLPGATVEHVMDEAS